MIGITAHSLRCCLLWLLIAVVTLPLVVITPVVAYAQGSYPQPIDLYVNDYATILTAQDTTGIRTLFANLKRDQGIEATVVTINSIRDYHTGDETIESFATHLFNTWGIGDRQRHDGVLILVAVHDRQVRIEAGSGYASDQDANMQQVINEHMLPHFRRNDYSQGVYQGARAIVGTLTGIWPADLRSPALESTPAVTPPQSRSSASRIYIVVVILGALAALGAATFGLRRYGRYRKRRCPDCQTYMTCLPEEDEGLYLDYGQKHEKIFDSVDYDVWECPQCGRHTVYRYKRWLSHRRRNSSSWRQGFELPSERSSTSDRFDGSSLDSTNGSSSGHSSSSSFGGGHSSGGGASGNW